MEGADEFITLAIGEHLRREILTEVLAVLERLLAGSGLDLFGRLDLLDGIVDEYAEHLAAIGSGD